MRQHQPEIKRTETSENKTDTGHVLAESCHSKTIHLKFSIKTHQNVTMIRLHTLGKRLNLATQFKVHTETGTTVRTAQIHTSLRPPVSR